MGFSNNFPFQYRWRFVETTLFGATVYYQWAREKPGPGWEIAS